MTDHPKVSAIVPARNDADHLDIAVMSFLGQDYAGSLQAVIAVGPSHDATEEVAERVAAIDDRVVVVANPAGGTAAALNAARRHADGAVIVRVDAHCELPAGYVRRAVETLARTGAANVGGIQNAEGETAQQRAIAQAMSSKFGVGDARFHFGGTEGPTDTVYLGVFDAAALAQVGGFDETLVRNQDYELNWRLREAGHTVWFDPALVVRYVPRGSLRALASQYYQYGQWKREVLRRHPKSVRARQLIAPLTVIGIGAGLLGALLGRRWMLVAPATYGAAVAAASAATSSDPDQAVRLAAVYPTMHLCWGAGFLVGPPTNAEPPRMTDEGQH